MSLRALATSVSETMFGDQPAPRNNVSNHDTTETPVPRVLVDSQLSRDSSGFWMDVSFPSFKGGGLLGQQQQQGRGGGPVARIGPFASEALAQEAGRNFAPPVWQKEGERCRLCRRGFAMLRRVHHCRNCGLCICDDCSRRWPAAALPESYLATDAKAVYRATTNYATGFGQGSVGSKEFTMKWTEAASTRVCKACDDTTAEFRAALLAGVDAGVARRNFDSGKWANVNFWRPLAHGFQMGGLLPVHLAVASGSLPLVKWLVLERHCPIDGPNATSAAVPSKTVLRVAIEHAAVDILQWLIAADASPAHRLPLPMPPDTGVHTQVLHRCLEAAVREAYRSHVLLEHVLDDTHHGAQIVPVELPRHSIFTDMFHQPNAPPLHNDPATPDEVASSDAPFPKTLAPPLDDVPSSTVPPVVTPTGRKECVVCFESSDLCALVPCGHACVCVNCGGALAECPMCRAKVDHAMRIFVE